MMDKWQQWCDKFFELTAREKWIIAGASIFLVVYFMFTLLVEPEIKRLKENTDRIVLRSNELTSINQQILATKAALSVDPNEALKRDISEARERLDELKNELTKVLTDYVLPEQMPRELSSVLKTSPAVRVIGMSVSPPEVVEIVEAQESVELPTYYRHEFIVTIAGEYFPLMAFVEKIVTKNQQFRVDDLTYEVKEYPTAHMTLSLVTISDSENVIRL